MIQKLTNEQTMSRTTHNIRILGVILLTSIAAAMPNWWLTLLVSFVSALIVPFILEPTRVE
jgi:hypothetical protein